MTDVTSGDGIYSAWISNVSTTSFTYSIQYMAYGVNGLAQVDSGKIFSSELKRKLRKQIRFNLLLNDYIFTHNIILSKD